MALKKKSIVASSIIALTFLTFILSKAINYNEELMIKQKAEAYKESLPMNSSFLDFLKGNSNFSELTISSKDLIKCLEIKRPKGENYFLEDESSPISWSSAFQRVSSAFKEPKCREVKLLFFREGGSLSSSKALMSLNVNQEGYVISALEFHLFK